jgi:Vitamin K-dependent gamma-carboxylase
VRSWWSRWVRLLDTRESGESLAMLRIVAAATVLGTLAHAGWSGAASLLWVAPEQGGVGTDVGGPLAWLGGLGPGPIRILLFVALSSATLLGVGLFTRAAAFGTWLSARALLFANPWSGGAGDDVLSNVLFILVFADSGRVWSVDARRRARDPGGAAGLVPAWPRYLAVGQLVTIYIGAGWHKMSASWMPHGSLDAVWYSLHNPLWQRAPMPTGAWLGRLSQALTLGTWLFEVGSPLVLLAFYFRATAARPGRLRGWFNRWDVRAIYLACGLGLHLGIEATMEVGCFFGAMMALYAACLTPSEWRRLYARFTVS